MSLFKDLIKSNCSTIISDKFKNDYIREFIGIYTPLIISNTCEDDLFKMVDNCKKDFILINLPSIFTNKDGMMKFHFITRLINNNTNKKIVIHTTKYNGVESNLIIVGGNKLLYISSYVIDIGEYNINIIKNRHGLQDGIVGYKQFLRYVIRKNKIKKILGK